jgi:hypothetical protein
MTSLYENELNTLTVLVRDQSVKFQIIRISRLKGVVQANYIFLNRHRSGVSDGFYWFSNVSPELTATRFEFKLRILGDICLKFSKNGVKIFLYVRTGRYTGPKNVFFYFLVQQQYVFFLLAKWKLSFRSLRPIKNGN